MIGSATMPPYPLPNEVERSEIFYFLKRVTSYTAWNRIFSFYKEWESKAEISIKEASALQWDDKTGISESRYVLILKGLAHFEQGLIRLKKGDKRVFKYDANGEFAMAARPVDRWIHFLDRASTGDTGINYAFTPHWSAFKHAVLQLNDAWRECGMIAAEDHYLDASARLPYGEWLQTNLPLMTFPTPLPPVPDPPEQRLVATGKMIPCSGIWEPVEAPKRRGFSMFRSEPIPEGPLPIAACMNYLHGGSAAPKAVLETADDSLDIATTWRLLWRDDRYEDGTIPAEESDYVFVLPSADVEPAPEISVATSKIVWADSGQISSHTGRWLLEANLAVSIEVQAGDKLPLHQGRPVRWVLAD